MSRKLRKYELKKEQIQDFEYVTNQFMCVCQTLGRICGHILFQIIKDLMTSLETGRLQSIVSVSTLSKRIGTVFQQ